MALARASYSLPDEAIVVEVGSFLGKSSVVLGGARKLRGSGRVHCVDPFDGSGDHFSLPAYRAISRDSPLTLRERFEASLRHAGLTSWMVVHQGTAEAISSTWTQPIDMLFLDADQSPQGARSAYERFVPFLKPNGVLALHNSSEREYAVGHDGYRRLVMEELRAPRYFDIYSVESTTFATKTS
jgi:predicted O-methyltransferase YrrM